MTAPVDPPGNVIEGTDDRDKLIGSRDDDTIKGLGGRDVINGRAGNDVLEGGDGNDQIRGSAGDDVLGGGQGADYLKGGSGIDTFVYKQLSTGVDFIADFKVGIDLIDLSAIFADSQYDSATPFEDYVRIGSSRGGRASLEVLDIGATAAEGSPVFKELAVLHRVSSSELSASDFVV